MLHQEAEDLLLVAVRIVRQQHPSVESTEHTWQVQERLLDIRTYSRVIRPVHARLREYLFGVGVLSMDSKAEVTKPKVEGVVEGKLKQWICSSPSCLLRDSYADVSCICRPLGSKHSIRYLSMERARQVPIGVVCWVVMTSIRSLLLSSMSTMTCVHEYDKSDSRVEE